MPPYDPSLAKLRRTTRGRGITIEEVRRKMAEQGLDDGDEDEATEEVVAEKVLAMMFRGKKCKTAACTGHRAGYDWKTRGKSHTRSGGSSFDEGYSS